jgi:hypothetical protein
MTVAVDGARAQRAVRSVEEFERSLLQFARNSIRWVQPRFPATGVREPAERGQWDESGSRVFMQRTRELLDGAGFEVVRLVRQPRGDGSVRVKAVGLSEDDAFEVSWLYVAGPDCVVGTSIELSVAGKQQDEAIRDFLVWFGGSSAGE